MRLQKRAVNRLITEARNWRSQTCMCIVAILHNLRRNDRNGVATTALTGRRRPCARFLMSAGGDPQTRVRPISEYL